MNAATVKGVDRDRNKAARLWAVFALFIRFE